MQSLFDYPRRALFAIAVFLIAVIFYSSWKLTFAATTGSMAALVMSSAFLLMVLIVVGLGHVVDTLKPLLEARVGGAVQAFGTQAQAYINQLSHRQLLEQGTANALVQHAMAMNNGKHPGKIAREALDALMGAGEQKAGGPLKVAVPDVADPAMPGPSVTAEHIAAMMARVEYRFDQPGSTTSTFAHAFLDGTFYLDTGHSACVSPENFNRATGEKYALEQAETKARNKLWAMEGYLLRSKLAA